MKDNILPFPTLNEDLYHKIKYQTINYSFFYTDKEEDEYDLTGEPVEVMSSIFCIKDENGKWTQDDYNLGFRRKYCLQTFKCLFGEHGIACEDATLGLAIQWTSPDSHQRGVVRIGEFTAEDTIFEKEVEKLFSKAQLRGEVTLTTIIYLAKPGSTKDLEQHLANKNGYILGELDSCTIRLDGNSSAFPIFEVYEPRQPLWYIKCDWLDPTVDLFTDCVSINLNKAHKNYMYIDRNQKVFDSQLLAEIMASAITLIVEKIRLEPGYWEQITQNDGLEQGSVGQAIYYFQEALEWDLSTPETVSLCARKFFDSRM